jgi:hypothetical protein
MKPLCYRLVVLALMMSSAACAQEPPAAPAPETAVPTSPGVNYTAIKSELLLIHEEDQQYRLEEPEVEKLHGRDSPQMKALWKLIQETDATNLAKVTTILDRHGWLGAAQIGPTANGTLFW